MTPAHRLPEGPPYRGVMRENLVGVRGFEPPAPASRTQCSTRLSYTPTEVAAYSPPREGRQPTLCILTSIMLPTRFRRPSPCGCASYPSVAALSPPSPRSSGE